MEHRFGCSATSSARAWPTSATPGAGGSTRKPTTARSTASAGTINPPLIRENWPDAIRLAGSLKLGHLKAADIMRTLQVRDKPTTLARALSEIGRIAKTAHILHHIDDAAFRGAS